MPRNAPIATIGAEDLELYINDGTDYRRLKGFSGYSVSGGEREGRSIASDTTGPSGAAGAEGAPQIEFESMRIPQQAAWTTVTSRYRNKTLTQFRLDTEQVILKATTSGSDTAEIDTNGAVTWAGTVPVEGEAREGATLRIGTVDFDIDTVNPDTQATTVRPAPASAVSAGAYDIRIPRLRLEFSGFILATPTLHGSAAQGSELTGPLRIQLNGPMPDFTRQAYVT